MMNRKNRISFSRTKTMLAGIAAVAMLVSLPACVRRQENEPMPFAPQEETDMDTERIPYVINNEYVLDMGGMDALLQPEDYTFVPTESDLTILRSLEEQYPEYAERIQFFIDHIEFPLDLLQLRRKNRFCSGGAFRNTDRNRGVELLSGWNHTSVLYPVRSSMGVPPIRQRSDGIYRLWADMLCHGIRSSYRKPGYYTGPCGGLCP